MESLEPLEVINKRLSDYYGTVWDNRPIFRVIWSEDQFEKQLCHYSDAGVMLIYPEWREMPKYRQWVTAKFILERLVAVPEMNQGEVAEQTSYEPVWVFETNTREALPVKWEVVEIIVDTLYAAIGKKSMKAKYLDPLIGEDPEARNLRIDKLQDELFGNETDVGDALAYKSGVVVPHNYIKN